MANSLFNHLSAQKFEQPNQQIFGHKKIGEKHDKTRWLSMFPRNK